jgi:trk system potassium uptake protein TrkA
MARQLKATVICGDGSAPAVLDDAGAHEADVVLAITTHDETNLVVCQIADKHFHVPTTLAVVSDPDNEAVFPVLGVKNVVSLTKIVSSLIGERAEVEEIANLIPVGEGRVNVVELKLTSDCPVLGRPLAEVPLPADTLIACILRGEETIVPRGAATLAAGDRVILVTVPQSHGAAIKTLTGEL